MRIAVPDAHVTPEILNAALEATTLANQEMLANGNAPPISEAIKNGAVKWKPEPFTDGEHFDLGPTVVNRGWGDCDDLAPALAAELREAGIDARATVRRSGPKRWHVVTELPSGRIVDPSAMAGMYEYKKKHGDSYVAGPGDWGLHGSAVVRSLSTDGEAVIGVKRLFGGWAARCDLPIDGADVDIVGVAHHVDPMQAIFGAVDTASVVGAAGELVDPEVLARAYAVREALTGGHPANVMAVVGDDLSGDEVIGIFGKIFKGLKSVASPLAKLAAKAAPFVPIPGVSLAAQAASSLLNKKGGGGGAGPRPPAAPIPGAPGLAAWQAQPPTVQAPQGPSGPIIVKF